MTIQTLLRLSASTATLLALLAAPTLASADPPPAPAGGAATAPPASRGASPRAGAPGLVPAPPPERAPRFRDGMVRMGGRCLPDLAVSALETPGYLIENVGCADAGPFEIWVRGVGFVNDSGLRVGEGTNWGGPCWRRHGEEIQGFLIADPANEIEEENELNNFAFGLPCYDRR